MLLAFIFVTYIELVNIIYDLNSGLRSKSNYVMTTFTSRKFDYGCILIKHYQYIRVSHT